MRPIRPFLMASIMLVLLAGCTNTSMGRVLSGSAIGATIGTVGALAIDSNPVGGALAGAAIGGVLGALNDHEDPDFK